VQQVDPATRPSRRDPAPSRLNYRIQRLLLTPMIRRLVWVGLPVLCLTASVALYLSDQARRDAITAMIDNAKAAVRERPEFMVKLMAIDGASAGVAEDIREILPIDFPVSSFDLDLSRMRNDLVALPAVAGVEMRVKPGGVLEVSIDERVPVAILRTRGALDLVDREGVRVAPLATRFARPDLPLIAGPGAERSVDEAMELFRAAAPLSDILRGLVRVGERRWDLVLDGGRTIRLPGLDPIPALEQVIAHHEAQDLLAREVRVVDMRNPRRPTVRMGEAATERLRQIRTMELGVD
jgi:cell division protein FtsQ